MILSFFVGQSFCVTVTKGLRETTSKDKKFIWAHELRGFSLSWQGGCGRIEPLPRGNQEAERGRWKAQVRHQRQEHERHFGDPLPPDRLCLLKLPPTLPHKCQTHESVRNISYSSNKTYYSYSFQFH